ncbi:MAG: LamG-like jellyroll fold domain-containing protein, partial [Pseudomonadales bacterium]
ACVFDGSEASLFVNGSLEGTASLSGSAVAGSEDIVIGARNASAPTQFFDGTIDEVRFWNTPRTQQQIHNDAYLDVSSDPDLIAYYDFNQGVANGDNSSYTILPDLTGNGNDGLLQGPFTLNFATSNWITSTAFDNDVFAPYFISGYPLIDNIGTTGFDITVQLNEEGTYFYVVVTDGSPAPTVGQVTTASATGQVTSGNINVTTPASDFVLSPSGLAHGTDYDLYIVAQDDEGSPNVQNANLFVDVTTLCDDPVVTPFITDNTFCVGGNGEITVTASTGFGEPASNYTMTIYEGVGTGGPIADGGAGTNSNVVGAAGLTVSNLIPNTYTIEVINNDNGCSDISNVAVADNSTNPTINGGSIIVTNDSSVGASDGALDATGTASGTPGPYTYQWYSDAGLTTSVGSGPSVGSLSAGTYYLEVTDDPTGCVQTTSINVLTDPPIAPDGLIAYNSSGTDITLEWSDNSSDETGFIIESSTDLAFGSPTDITSAVTPPNPGPGVTSVVLSGS